MPQLFTIAIGFTNTPPTVTANPESVRVDYGKTAIIQLNLSTRVAGVAFAAQPVVWDKAPPAGTVVNRSSDTRAQIVENDEATETTGYSFRAQVTYNGQTYLSPDPLLINQGPP